MKTALNQFVIAAIVLFMGVSNSAVARDRDHRGYSNYQCSFEDKGWEEHGGGHDSCGECLRHHGKCIRTCYEETYKCTVLGTDRYGTNREFVEEGSSQWRLEQMAMDRCDYLRYERCEPKGCQKVTNLISRDRC